MTSLALGFSGTTPSTGFFCVRALRGAADHLGQEGQRPQPPPRLRHPGMMRSAKLFTEIGPAFSERPGGYTRIMRMGNRVGDAASWPASSWSASAKPIQ